MMEQDFKTDSSHAISSSPTHAITKTPTVAPTETTQAPNTDGIDNDISGSFSLYNAFSANVCSVLVGISMLNVVYLVSSN